MLAAVAVVVLLAGCSSGETTTAPTTEVDITGPPGGAGWPRFGYDAARSNVFPGVTAITAKNASRLEGQQVRLPGTADS
jgi:hypothetical protein